MCNIFLFFIFQENSAIIFGQWIKEAETNAVKVEMRCENEIVLKCEQSYSHFKQ